MSLLNNQTGGAKRRSTKVVKGAKFQSRPSASYHYNTLNHPVGFQVTYRPRKGGKYILHKLALRKNGSPYWKALEALPKTKKQLKKRSSRRSNRRRSSRRPVRRTYKRRSASRSRRSNVRTRNWTALGLMGGSGSAPAPEPADAPKNQAAQIDPCAFCVSKNHTASQCPRVNAGARAKALEYEYIHRRQPTRGVAKSIKDAMTDEIYEEYE